MEEIDVKDLGILVKETGFIAIFYQHLSPF
jgi:hypothetical protein